MGVNKVVYDGKALIDLTNDSVTPSTLAEGVTAHDATGAIITGTATPITLVHETGDREDAVMSQKAITDMKDNMVGEILTLIGTPIAGAIDENNVITLGGELAEGTYTLRYFDQDEYIEIGTLTISDEPEITYINLLPTATSHTALNTVFNQTGYMNGVRPSSSSPYYSAQSGYVVTGCFPCTFNSVFYIKGITLNGADSSCRLGWGRTQNGALNTYYVKHGEIAGEGNYCTFETLGDQYYKVTFNESYLKTNCPLLSHFFFGGVGSGENIIVSTTPIE